MELSAEMFEQAVAVMKGYGPSTKQSERTQPRVGVRCHVTLHSVGAGMQTAPIEAWTRDFSRGGIGFVCWRRIKRGSRYSLILGRRDGEPPFILFCTVQNCTELAPGIFAAGAIFDAACDPKGEPPAAVAAKNPPAAASTL